MNDSTKIYYEFSQKLQNDEQFKNRFLNNPKQILVDMEFNIPDSMQVKVIEDSLQVSNFVIPVKSQQSDLTISNPVFEKIVRQAWSDDNFKTRLLEQPKTVLQEFTGEEIPETITVRIYEDTPNLKHLVISNNLASEELNEAELEAVAGGILRLPFSLPTAVAGMRSTPFFK